MLAMYPDCKVHHIKKIIYIDNVDVMSSLLATTQKKEKNPIITKESISWNANELPCLQKR